VGYVEIIVYNYIQYRTFPLPYQKPSRGHKEKET